VRRLHVVAAAGIFAVAVAVRWWLLCGFILGDDAQEFGTLQQVLAQGPDFRDQLNVRVGGWLPNYVAAALLGLSETTILLPTLLLSSSFGVLGHRLLLHWGYGPARAFAGGLLVATAPFEVVLGTFRANDLYLAGALGIGFVLLVLLERRPLLQGVAVALALWFGFYVKLWAVFALPLLVLYAAAGRRGRAAAAFVATSVVLHGASLLFWKAKLGIYLPFVASHAANYPVAPHRLLAEWAKYPYMIFVGSEFRTTLFGVVPWVLAILLAVRVVRGRLDRADGLLLGFWGGLLLLIEFFPAGFSLDGYYTVPRIFRYLAPVSFPLALHAAKLVLDATRDWRPAWTMAAVALLLALNLLGALDATWPGRVHRRALLAVVGEIERLAPPRVVAEDMVGYWLQALYLDPVVVETQVTTPPDIYPARDCEKWIRDAAPTWPTGTLLVTGLANYVHYGAHTEGFRLTQFERPLDDRWELVGAYGPVSYLPQPEEARLWRLVRGAGPPPLVRDDPPPAEPQAVERRHFAGMAAFDAQNYRTARAHFRVVMDAGTPDAPNAAFFYAASFFREESWDRAAREFKRLIRRFPQSSWVPAAHWHVAICDLRRGRTRRALAGFRAVVRRFPQDGITVENARIELRRMARRRGLLGNLVARLAGDE
jgi:hypothetical protein